MVAEENETVRILGTEDIERFARVAGRVRKRGAGRREAFRLGMRAVEKAADVDPRRTEVVGVQDA